MTPAQSSHCASVLFESLCVIDFGEVLMWNFINRNHLMSFSGKGTITKIPRSSGVYNRVLSSFVLTQSYGLTGREVDTVTSRDRNRFRGYPRPRAPRKRDSGNSTFVLNVF